ncbi:DUF4082 domain-containing protein [Microbispora sp. NEAU-D428]|uniref:DUF4082 domain-containing protein n=1 Tax=Microbispora sitophila TaxID=2771537 RepID=UPI001868F5AD|nr:DUF4082 domain-containing protein [Microbispora sitophila]MBE3012359.1 DUF4082 domain-containing protein [Microbispora sitophila]
MATPKLREVSFWTPATKPEVPVHADHAPVELGSRFTVTEDGWITGVRFYKARGEKGRHSGSLWDADGRRLATAAFVKETPSGWQEVRFGSPVQVRAHETYTVSYHSEHGTYVARPLGRGKAPRSGPLTAVPRKTGVYRYGDGGFPRESNPRNYHYYVDPIYRWWWRPRPSHPTTLPSAAPSPAATRSPAQSPVQTPVQSPTLSPGQTAGPTRVPTPSQSATLSISPSAEMPTPTPTPTRTRHTPTPTPTEAVESPAPTPTVTRSPATPVPSRSETTTAPDTGGTACPGYPTPACTGVPKGTRLKTLQPDFYGAYRVTKDGTVLDGVHIPGTLLITAQNVTVRNSQIDGDVKNDYDGKIYPFTISDSTVGPENGCNQSVGIWSAQFTATRVHVRNHSDGFSVSGDNVVIRDSYVLLCSRPGDHSDGIQTVGAGHTLVFDHNTVDQRYAPQHTAPVFLVDPNTGVQVTDNLLIGGTYTIRVRAASGAVVRDNAVVNQAWDYGPSDSDCPKTTWTGNRLVTIDDEYNVTSTVKNLPCQG